MVSATRESTITEALVHHMCQQIVYRTMKEFTWPTALAGEVFVGVSENLFDLEFRVHDFAFSFASGRSERLRVGHRMTANLEALCLSSRTWLASR